MSDLPSRESIADELAQLATTTDLFDALPPGALFNILIIASEWASGRLVDREAIDHEAAGRLLRETFGDTAVVPSSWTTLAPLDWVALARTVIESSSPTAETEGAAQEGPAEMRTSPRCRRERRAV